MFRVGSHSLGANGFPFIGAVYILSVKGSRQGPVCEGIIDLVL